MSAKIPDKPAKASKDTIYIDVDDEITAIIDKVEASKEKITALVLPKRFTTLQSVVNMRLLKRNADKAGKSVVLITSEAALLPLAGAAGLHVAKNLQSKPAIPPSPLAGEELPGELDVTESDDDLDEPPTKIDYARPIGELAAAHEIDEPETIPLDDAAEAEPAAKKPTSKLKKSKLAVPNFDRFRLLMVGGIGGFILLIIFIFLALFVLPKASIAVQTTSTPIAANFDLTTSGSAQGLDTEKGIIPSVNKSSQQTGSQQVPATGQQNNGQKATGTVKVTNCTDNAVTLPAGTGLSSGGLTFLTQSSLSLDSGNFTSGHVCKTTGSHVGSVNVTAQSAGSKYNIGPSSFTVSGFSGVNGSSGSSMSGGTDNIVTVVSQQDVDNAKQKIAGQSSEDFKKKFEKDISDSGYYIFPSTEKVTEPDTAASPVVGQQASTVTVTTKVTYSVLAVKKDDLKKVITNELDKKVDTKKQKISSADVVKDATITVGNQKSPTDATLTVNENTTAVPIIDVENVKKQAAGQKVGDIRAILNGIPGVEKVDVKLSPFWVSKAPKKQSRIEVKLEQVKPH